MKNKKLKKIIFKAIAIIFINLILAVNVQAETEKNQVEFENDFELPYSYLIIGWGYIGSMTINDQEAKIGKLEGSLYIWNMPGWKSPENYKLIIIDKFNNKVFIKNTLPEKFTLIGLIGFGYIQYVNIPHHLDATKYFIIGKAIDLLE